MIKPTVNQLVNNYQRQTDRPANRTGQHAGTLTTVFHSTRTQQCGMDSVVWKNLNVIKPRKRTNKKIVGPEKRSRCREICRECPPQSTRKNVASAHLRAQGKMLRVPTSEHKEKCCECPHQSTRKNVASAHLRAQGKQVNIPTGRVVGNAFNPNRYWGTAGAHLDPSQLQRQISPWWL